jgi:ribosomal protein S24E
VSIVLSPTTCRKRIHIGRTFTDTISYSDVLHPNRANVSKDELRQKLAELYKANKDQVSCFGFRTQYGGGKSTGFALIYDSHEVMKKFEPHYRLVRYGAATKIEKASRQQRMCFLGFGYASWCRKCEMLMACSL